MLRGKASEARSATTTSSVSGPSTSIAEKVRTAKSTEWVAQLADHQAGLAKAIMRYHQEKAQSENLPIWLEATTESSRYFYLSIGFQEVEKITLGKGKVAADASLQPDGPGVTLYAMVWWPKSTNHNSEPASTIETP